MTYYLWPFIVSLQQLLPDMTFSAYLSVSDCGRCRVINGFAGGEMTNSRGLFQNQVLIRVLWNTLVYFTWGICWLVTVVFWYSPVTFLACIYEASDITVYLHVIKVSDKTSVNFNGTRLRPGYLGELLYWSSILLFTLEGSCITKKKKKSIFLH